MPDAIRVTMFEVQLGAAMLLQFETRSGPVRVLADAGLHAKGYEADHVLRKLRRMQPRVRRIDLMIGTHYDQDHLNGLVPIIEDPGMSIGEAWLPPVVNDAQDFALDDPVDEHSLLTVQLNGEDGDNVLDAYLAQKYKDIQGIVELETALSDDSWERNERPAQTWGAEVQAGHLRREGFFEQYLEDRHREDACDHAADVSLDPSSSLRQHLRPWRHARDIRAMAYHRTTPAQRAQNLAQHDPLQAKNTRTSLTHLRHTIAKEAINAKALHRVVRALKKKGVPIHSRWIVNGKPKRFEWNGQRFFRTNHQSAELAFDLLGPSLRLIKKHRKRLPPSVGRLVAFEFNRPVRSITPSNQLSYVMCFRHADQNILVSGDAGMVDFSPRSRAPYHPELLRALQPLHVVQIAHHGGRNAHFYRVLAHADYAKGLTTTYLLLSHATHDTHRPSEDFSEFAVRTADAGTTPTVLFTSKPDKARVVEFASFVHPPVPHVRPVGDIVLVYDGTWNVRQHKVKP